MHLNVANKMTKKVGRPSKDKKDKQNIVVLVSEKEEPIIRQILAEMREAEQSSHTG